MTISGWIKQFMPRGLYGRAALILLVPIVTIQLVVSSAFLQRHFEDVTRELTRALVLDLHLVMDLWQADGPEAAGAVARALDIQITIENPAPEIRRSVFDISGVTVVAELERRLDGIMGIDLASDTGAVSVLVAIPGEGTVGFRTSRRRVSAPAPHQLLVIMGLTGILMTGVSFVFLRNQIRPIRRLARAAEAFGRGQAIDYHPSGASEVRAAGRAFMEMRTRIENHLEQRTLMLSGVSHDLRTPLTRMRLSLGMMEEGEDRAALIQDVEDMEALLNTFLDFVRGEALDDPAPSIPAELLRCAVEKARRGGGPAIELVVPETSGEAPASIQMRPLAVGRALDNLLSNAARYGGRVRASVVEGPRHMRFRIEDDGPGIPPERREEALRPFIRLDTARNQNKGSGVGLGLAITNDIAKRHGGSLILGQSADLGGLQVDLRLPR